MLVRLARTLTMAVVAAVLLQGGRAAVAQEHAARVRKVTNIETSYPSWSPDGRQLVFQSDRNGNSDIYISNVDGSGLRRLTDHPAPDLTPVWSPDGTTIVFQSVRDGREHLFRISVDGTGLQQLTTAAANHGHPKWAPDGKTLIYNSNVGEDSNNEEVYEMDLDGGNVRKLTTHPLWDTYASISPDGRSIVFRRVTATPGIDGALQMIERNSEVFVARRDGSQPVNVTNSAAFDGWPAWSPDSQFIAFSSNRSGDFQVYVMRHDGTGVRRLTSGPGSFTKPIWSPDGGEIVCTRTLDGNVEIFIIDAEMGTDPIF